MTITLDSYTASTGCLYFTILGAGTANAVAVESSIDNGATWGSSTGSTTSPRCGFTVTQPTLFRLRLNYNTSEFVYSNVYSTTGLIRTDIDSVEQISFCNSPIYARITNDATDNTLQSVKLKLWIWNGNQNKTLANPNFTFFSQKISVEDTYILFQIDEYIKSFLINPINASNTNQPQFLYNELTEPTITGQGVFWQIQAEITSSTGVVVRDFNTNFATLGNRWNYEQGNYSNNGIRANESLGFDTNVRKWYNSKVHHYFEQSFNLTNSYTTATTANMINRNIITPPIHLTKDCRDGMLIVFINKLGLFETFTPTGSLKQSVKIKDEVKGIAYRDVSRVDNTYQHSKSKSILEALQSYQLNTGLLYEDMAELVEQIIYSPKIYFIKFKGDLQLVSTLGITIDNTSVTIDGTNITIDSTTTTSEEIGFYKTHRQYPVICTDNDYQFKNTYNDKTSIDYTIKLEETTSKIL